MKKTLATFALLALISVAAPSPAMAANPKVGAKCTTVGETKTVYANAAVNKGKTYTCTTKNKRTVWASPVVAVRVQSKLSISQLWKGNTVVLSLLDSAGNDCSLDANQIAGAECKGFYIGWKSNFKDEERTVDYSKVETTTISGLQLGDKGEFLLMYQETPTSNPVVVKGFPFNYSY